MVTRQQGQGGNQQRAGQDDQHGGPALENISRLTVKGITYEMTSGNTGEITVSGQVQEGALSADEVEGLGRFFGRLLRRRGRDDDQGGAAAGNQQSDGRGRVVNPATDLRVGNKSGHQGRNRGGNGNGNKQ